LKRFIVKGFFKKTHCDFNPTNVSWLINFCHSDVIKFYNSVIRANLNYFFFVKNRKLLSSFIHGLKWSCTHTLALKFKFRQSSTVFYKFGSKLKCPDTGNKLFIFKTFAVIKRFSINEQISSYTLNKLTKSSPNKRYFMWFLWMS
jgi:hypothetical protein